MEKNWKVESLNPNGVPDESLSKLERPQEGKTLRLLLRKYLEESKDFNEAVDKALDKLGLSIPSRIFGCTGWKSRIQLIIENYSVERIEFKEIETRFPLNSIRIRDKRINSEFWIKTSLFMENISEPIQVFKDVKIRWVRN